MQVQTFAATLGLGMVAGAAVMLMVPKHSAIYQAADDAARTVKRSVTNAVEQLVQE